MSALCLLKMLLSKFLVRQISSTAPPEESPGCKLAIRIVRNIKPLMLSQVEPSSDCRKLRYQEVNTKDAYIALGGIIF